MVGDGDRRTLSRREALRTLAGGALALGGLGLTSCAPFLAGSSGGPTLPPGVAIIKTPLLVLKGHTAAVNTVAWSPDGTKVATTSDDFTAQIWDVATGASLLTYRNHTDKVWDIAWSPDGKRILSASRDMTAQIWDPTNGQLQTTFTGHTKGVLSAAWSQDGTKIATGSVDWTAQIWDVASAKSLVTYTKHISWVYTVAWSHDGKQIASASNDYTAHVWDADTDEIEASYEGHVIKGTVEDGSPTGLVHTVAWAPDNTRLASASLDKTAHIWRLP